MNRIFRLALLLILSAAALVAAPPGNLVSDGIPEVPQALVEKIAPYLEYRTAGIRDWHPEKRSIVIGTRFGNTTQIHVVEMPGGARRQITFFEEPVSGGLYQPGRGDRLLFLKDVGGSEFYQIFSYDAASGGTELLTDGKSRNGAVVWSAKGDRISWTSTRRNGRSNDVWIMNPENPSSARLVVEAASGGYWAATDWSPDDSKLAVAEYISANESHLYLVDLKSGERKRLSPERNEKVAWGSMEFSHDGRSVYTTTDLGGEFERLARIDLESGKVTILTDHIPWDVSGFELQPKGNLIAFVTNENGIGVLHLFDASKNEEVPAPKLPVGIVSGLEWRPDGKELGFQLQSAQSPSDVYSVDLANGEVFRWTMSETGGLDLTRNVEPELVALESFDGLEISAFVYRPDPKRFPGKRPVVVSIHGGPEGQSRPGFLGRNNYFLNEMGIALVYPNVRGSSGYGKTYLQLDNAMKREDSVKDIATVLDWIAKDDRLDEDRIAVYGGSYGGYMVLASMIHFADRLAAGIDVVGISDFITFLTNTEDYRRDLRRVEYGDERDPEMRAFFERISPLRQASKIADPLFVIQGLNDPRVPASESEQIVKAVRTSGNAAWYLLAKDEGHGFRKKENQDYQFFTMVMFLQRHLLE